MTAGLAQYVDLVWPTGEGWIALRSFHEKGRPFQFPRNEWVRADDPRRVEKIAAFVRECDRRGMACYCIPGVVRAYKAASAEDVVRFDTLCIDIDTGNINDIVRAVIEAVGRPSMVIRSGGITNDGQLKSYVFWKLARETTVAKVCDLRNRIARAFGGDASFQSAPQPIRIPTSVHHKAAPRSAEIAFYDPEASVDPWQVDLKLPQAESSPGGGGTLGFQGKVSLDDLIMRQIGHGETDINRFEAFSRVAGMMIANIHNIDDAAECEREFGYFAAWCWSHIENVQRDYDLRQHWRRLLARERAKRRGLAGYRPKFRPFRRSRAH